MSIKFLRTYRIIITDTITNEVIVIEPPISVNIKTSLNPCQNTDLNTADVKITGLSQKTRNLIFKDRLDFGAYKKISIEAGYGKQFYQIFTGTIAYAYSMRDLPNIVTVIHAFDGGQGVINSITSLTVSKNMPKSDIINKLVSNLTQYPDVNTGEIGSQKEDDTAKKVRGTVLQGNTFNLLNSITNNYSHVDMGNLNILQDNEVILGDVPLVNSSTGLLGTPQKQDAYIFAELLFEPRIKIQQVVDLESTIQTQYNGQFKVVAVEHALNVSEAECGEARTTIGLLAPPVYSTQSSGFNLVQNNIVTPLVGNGVIVGSDVQSVLKYIQKYGAVPNTWITNKISWRMALHGFRSGSSFHPSNETPTLQQLNNIKTTSIELTNVLNTVYPNASIDVTSGWRSQIGQFHVQGYALDFQLNGISANSVQNAIDENYPNRYYIGHAPQHTHFGINGLVHDFKDGDY